VEEMLIKKIDWYVYLTALESSERKENNSVSIIILIKYILSHPRAAYQNRIICPSLCLSIHLDTYVARRTTDSSIFFDLAFYVAKIFSYMAKRTMERTIE
jgi:hypothetical protein